MRDKAIVETGGTLKSVPECYNTQQMCDKAVSTYPSTIKICS